MRTYFQLGMEFETRTARIETRPGIKRKAQVDDTGVQCVDALSQLQSPRLVGVECPGLSDELLRQIGEDAPVPARQGVGQGAAMDWLPQTQVIELRSTRIEAGFDIPQTLAPSQLGEGQAHKLFPSGEVFDFVLAAVASDTSLKLLGMDAIEQLGEHETACKHASRLVAKSPMDTPPALSRSQPPMH